MAIQRMAVVDGDNKVVNVIVYDADGTWTPPEGCKIVQDGVFGRGDASPGGTWDGKRFAPKPPAPASPPSLEERIKALEAMIMR